MKKRQFKKYVKNRFQIDRSFKSSLEKKQYMHNLKIWNELCFNGQDDSNISNLLVLGSVALSFGWLAHLCISDKDFNIKTGFIFAGMLVLIGVTCYTTLNWN